MKSLLVICPNPKDGTSLYRCMGPLSHLKRTAPAGEEFQISIVEEVHWAWLANVDAVFLQRPFTDQHLQIVRMCRANGKPLWVDYDDNLFIVPKDNPTHRTYSKENHQKNVATILAMADRVSVSTEKLKRDFAPLRDKAGLPPCDVIPNALNELIFKEPPLRAQHRNALVMWRGSNTHDRDLMTFQREIVAAAKAYPSMTFSFIGDPLWMFMEALPANCLKTDTVDPIEYFDVIGRIKPQLAIVPLHGSDFNRCKSNIAWLEAAYAGAACIAPEWEEWKRPGCVTYKDAKEFEQHLKKLIAAPDLCRIYAEESWNYIKENLTLRTVNEKRRLILRDLFSSL